MTPEELDNLQTGDIVHLEQYPQRRWTEFDSNTYVDVRDVVCWEIVPYPSGSTPTQIIIQFRGGGEVSIYDTKENRDKLMGATT